MILGNNTTRKSITNTIFIPLYDTKLYHYTLRKIYKYSDTFPSHCTLLATKYPKIEKGAKQPMTQIKQITPSHRLANNSGKLALSYNYPSHTLSHSRVQPYIIIPPKIHHQSLLKNHPASSRSDHRYYDPFSFPLSP